MKNIKKAPGYEDQDGMLEKFKSLLSNDMMLIMQETMPTQQAIRRVNRLTEENIDLRAAIDESTCNGQSLDETFEMLLWEKLQKSDTTKF